MYSMKCIILYGPPAVGKLTVAKALAKMTNARVFDNHQVIDIVEPVIPRQTPVFRELVYSLQLQVINAALRFPTSDLIITFPFAANLREDVAYIQTLLEASKTHDATVELVRLAANRKTLLTRVVAESRKGTGKVTDPAVLEELMKEYDLESRVPGEPSTSINTSHLTPEEVAQQIVRVTKAIKD
jgi:tRNA uridine 5-carbamoylmethylation protein Kti12